MKIASPLSFCKIGFQNFPGWDFRENNFIFVKVAQCGRKRINKKELEILLNCLVDKEES